MVGCLVTFYTGLFFTLSPFFFFFALLCARPLTRGTRCSLFVDQVMSGCAILWVFSGFINIVILLDTRLNQPMDEARMELIPHSHMRLREYSSRYPEGYRLKDQSIRYRLVRKGLDAEEVIYDVTYEIAGSGRIRNREGHLRHACPRFVLIGDSHNFGQALNYDQTLQGFLGIAGHVINFAVPGYGLNNALAGLTERHKTSLDLNECRGDFSGVTFVYRMINDHINRNVGKTSFNPNGPDFPYLYAGNLELEGRTFRPFCDRLTTCAKYLFNYVRSTVNYRFAGSGEPTSIFLAELLASMIWYTENDYEYTVRLLQFSETFIKELFPGASYVILVEDGKYSFRSRKLEEDIALKPMLGDARIRAMEAKGLMVRMSQLINAAEEFPVACEKSDGLYIQHEGHPNGCNNALFANKLLTKFWLRKNQ